MFEFLTSLSAANRWTLAVILGLPLGMLLLTELAGRLRRRGQGRWASPVLIARNFLLPTLALYIVLIGIVEVSPDRTASKIVLTLLWMSIINAALVLLNVVLFDEASEGSWQSRVPRLLQDLGRLVLILVGLAIVLSWVWDADLKQVLGALGIGSLVIGLALQEPLGNLFSGLMLLFERPFSVGDQVKVGDITGQVVEINWRAVHVLRGAEVVVVPNSVLAKGTFTNVSRPNRQCSETLVLAFSCDDPPNKVKKVLCQLALETPGVLQEPPPSVQTAGYDSSSITYRLTFRVADSPDLGGVRDELLTRIWYAARRHGLTMPFPTHTAIQVQQADLDAAARAPVAEEKLRRFGPLGLTQAQGLEETLSQGAVRHYARGEVVVARGEPLPGLCLVLAGVASLSAPLGSGLPEQEVVCLGAGKFFGEKALLAASASEETVTAVDDLELLVLCGSALQRLVDQEPQAAREIGAVLEARRQALRQARSGNSRNAARTAPVDGLLAARGD